jgi:hypothetical protein
MRASQSVEEFHAGSVQLVEEIWSRFHHEVVEHMGSGQMMCELLLEQGVKASQSQQGWAAWSKQNGVASLHGRY